MENKESALRQHACIMGQCVLAMARIEGMRAENIKAEQCGDTPPYGERQFEEAMSEFPISENSVWIAFDF